MKASIISVAGERQPIMEGEAFSSTLLEGIVDLLIRVEIGGVALNRLNECLKNQEKVRLVMEDTESIPMTLHGYIKRARLQPVQSNNMGCHLSMMIDD
jgi:hypothetical protein